MSEQQNERRQHDVMDPARANALLTALGDTRHLSSGDSLPPFFHHLYFWEAFPPRQLGRDGHPKLGAGLIPDFGLPRRMWAGGRLTFDAPLRVGTPAEKRSRVADTVRKEGRTGPLVFVTLEHELWQDGTRCLRELQDLVYREDPAPDAPAPVPPHAPDTAEDSLDISFDTTLLFRYSALTFNGHRIHYDLDYARTVEGYDGLVVHGPLLAQLLMLWIDGQDAPLGRFEFRATAPLMHIEAATLCRSGDRAWVRGPDGRQCMAAKFSLAK